MKIKSGEYEVLYSGTVIGIKEQEIEFNFPEVHASLKIIIDFKIDDSIKDSPIKIDLPGNKTLKLTLVNTASSLGTGNAEILEIGHINGKKLYLNYRIYAIQGISNTVHYTFYLGKEVTIGK
jgi:hypothetical protein